MLDANNKSQSLTLVLFCILPVLVFFLLIKIFIIPPTNFPAPYRLSIEKGQTLFSISQELYDADIIKSQRLFEIFMIILGGERSASFGEYYFEKPLSSLEIALRISGREFGINRKKVTFPEGFTIREMADRLAMTFPNFDKYFFISLAQGREGYLFPDTYTFFPSSTPEIILETLNNNFDSHIDPFLADIKKSGKSLNQIITMASIIEKEASGNDDMDTIAGILWKRFKIGMPLQVDAAFLYILDKKSNELTSKDLQTKSPYNTYINKGLTPTPIGNPGLEAIKAAIFPKDSPYLYYLHDKNGNIHYAKTYTEHKQNINKYLR